MNKLLSINPQVDYSFTVSAMTITIKQIENTDWLLIDYYGSPLYVELKPVYAVLISYLTGMPTKTKIDVYAEVSHTSFEQVSSVLFVDEDNDLCCNEIETDEMYFFFREAEAKSILQGITNYRGK